MAAWRSTTERKTPRFKRRLDNLFRSFDFGARGREAFQPAEVFKGCSDLQKNHPGFRRIRNQAIAQDDIAFAQHSGFAIVNDRGDILEIGAEN